MELIVVVVEVVVVAEVALVEVVVVVAIFFEDALGAFLDGALPELGMT